MVAENNQVGTSSSSYQISFTTPQTSKKHGNGIGEYINHLGAAESPFNVTVKDVQSSTIQIRWNGFRNCRYANGPIARFRIQYSALPNAWYYRDSCSYDKV